MGAIRVGAVFPFRVSAFGLLSDFGLRVSAFFVVALVGCSGPIPRDALVIVETPRVTRAEAPRDDLDRRYPSGSRIVLATGQPHARVVRVLSQGLSAAGEPVLSWDARRLVFAGKAEPEAEWQIYEASTEGGRYRRLTNVPGGAKDPALLPDGSLLFVSPVPKVETGAAPGPLPALYAQPRGAKARQLTFSSLSVADPTVLADGRILFVSGQPVAANCSAPASALYTINNDGTEITAFAGQHDPPSLKRRPRQLADGRIVFLVLDATNLQARTAETVLSARPFRSRAPLLTSFKSVISSVDPGPNGELLVCAKRPDEPAEAGGGGVFRMSASTTELGAPEFEEPDWNVAEAVTTSAGVRPMGRLSNVDPSHDTGQILCLDANHTSAAPVGQAQPERATRIRVFTQTNPTAPRTLGEVELQPDGSFMAEVPADLPLGFEALDEAGRVLRRDPALIWVRPGENRSCIGCHEPHNHSPKNVRPLAVRVPVPRLCGQPDQLVKRDK